jgi:hypothetical protein
MTAERRQEYQAGVLYAEFHIDEQLEKLALNSNFSL